MYSFNDNWSFAKTPLDEVFINELDFKTIEVLHDWLIYQTEDLYENSIGWYRRSFTYDQTEKIILRFDGVYMDSTLYVNGKYVGEWKYGYSAFEHDITDQ